MGHATVKTPTPHPAPVVSSRLVYMQARAIKEKSPTTRLVGEGPGPEDLGLEPLALPPHALAVPLPHLQRAVLPVHRLVLPLAHALLRAALWGGGSGDGA